MQEVVPPAWLSMRLEIFWLPTTQETQCGVCQSSTSSPIHEDHQGNYIAILIELCPSPGGRGAGSEEIPLDGIRSELTKFDAWRDHSHQQFMLHKWQAVPSDKTASWVSL